MPPRKPGYCDCCGEFYDGLTWVMGYNPEPGPTCGMIYGGWVCARCYLVLAAIREEKRKARESESQERTRRNENGQEDKDHDDAGRRKVD